MSLTHQQYADLSGDSYVNHKPGARAPGAQDLVTINGVAYNIVEHYSNPRNGYKGTIYQRADTGDIVVAHRGTEVDQGVKAIVQDAVYTDGSMALTRVNPQAKDAIELTRRAVGYAEDYGSKPGKSTPQVTVTGHSLGGCLAQITAHHFDLRGETFNAYGAASLDRRIPEGGSTVLNHVMAGDTVSAASPHFGQVRVYAAPNEIKSLERSGYENLGGILGALDQRAPLAAIGRTAGSHSMHNFLNVDGDGRADRSILADPNARALAKQNDPMIDRFRDDVGAIRAGLTVTARGPTGVIGDAVDALRGTLRPGEPAERETAEKRAAPHAPQKPSAPLPYDSPLFGPGGPFPDLPSYVPKPTDGPKFPQRPQAAADEAMPNAVDARTAPQLAIERLSPKDRDNYEQAHALARRLGLPQEQAQNFGMAMAAQISEYGLMPRTDQMIAMQGRGEAGGDRVYASYHPHGDKEPIFNTSLDVNRAANQPADDSFRRLEQAQQHHLAQQQNPALDDPARGQRVG
ncbi:MAG: lipase [Lysobacter sp.]|nr:MAG: lipase [Lysobacter sp.]